MNDLLEAAAPNVFSVEHILNGTRQTVITAPREAGDVEITQITRYFAPNNVLRVDLNHLWFDYYIDRKENNVHTSGDQWLTFPNYLAAHAHFKNRLRPEE